MVYLKQHYKKKNYIPKICGYILSSDSLVEKSRKQPLKDSPKLLGFKIRPQGQPAKDPPVFMRFKIRSLKQLMMGNRTPILVED